MDLGHWTLYGQWTRFDPRLGEIWIGAILRHWKALPPLTFRERILEANWPAVFGVLLDTAALVHPEPELFERWKDLVLHGVKPLGGEQYFIGLDRFGGKMARRESERAIDLYRRWGTLATELMLNKFPRERTRLSPAQRRFLLDEYLKTHSRITTAGYRRLLKGWVTARQAERDLAARRDLSPRGFTRGRVYEKV